MRSRLKEFPSFKRAICIKNSMVASQHSKALCYAKNVRQEVGRKTNLTTVLYNYSSDDVDIC